MMQQAIRHDWTKAEIREIYDTPLLDEMQSKLKANGGHVSAALQAIALSKQFREIRGGDVADSN